MNKKFWLTLTAGSFAFLSNCSKDDTPTDALEEALKKLEKSYTPKDLKMGAMCYSMVFSENLPDIDYLCPDCHRKTKYSMPSSDYEKKNKADYSERCHAYYDLGDLTTYRRFMKEIRDLLLKTGYSATLEESSFCSYCSPHQTDFAYFLVVKRPNGSLVKNKLESTLDMVVLKAFLEGKKIWEDDRDAQNDLKMEIPRIKKFLGLK